MPTNDPLLRPTVRTQLNDTELVSSLIRCWKLKRGAYPSKQTVCLIQAQKAFETGKGLSCFNFNIGNIKRGGKDRKYMFLHNVSEIVDGKKVVYNPPHYQCEFRAYDNLDEAVNDYLDLIFKRYKSALKALEAGDPVAFVVALKNGGYFTGPLDAYVKGVSALHAGYLKAKDYENARAAEEAEEAAPQPAKAERPAEEPSPKAEEASEAEPNAIPEPLGGAVNAPKEAERPLTRPALKDAPSGLAKGQEMGFWLTVLYALLALLGLRKR